MDIFKKLKKIRIEKGIKLNEVSKKTGLSSGFLSQVENGITKPSMDSLKKITDALNVSLAILFDPNPNVSSSHTLHNNEVKVVKSNQRRKLVLPKGDIIYHLLSPDLNRKIEFIFIEIEPGAKSGEENYTHDGEECGIVLKGKLELIIDNKSYFLEEGDSIYFPSNLIHSWKNIGDGKVLAVWAITPPSL